MPVEQLDLDDYVTREDRFADQLKTLDQKDLETPPQASPSQLPPPPGMSGYGPVGQTIYDAFQPPPPGTDPMSLRPTDLLRQLRQGIVSDEDLAAIKQNPLGLQAMGAYAQGAIALSRGAGRGENLNWRIVPGEEWANWKTVQHPLVGEGPAPEHSTDVVRPAVKQAPDGSYYEYQGSHVTQHPVDTDTGRNWIDVHNIVAIPVEGPTGSAGWKERLMADQPEPGSQEWFQKKSDDFQKKNFPKLEPGPQEGFPYEPGKEKATPEQLDQQEKYDAWVKENYPESHGKLMEEHPGPDTPAQKEVERLRQLKQAQSEYLKSAQAGHSEEEEVAWQHYIEDELGGTLPKPGVGPDWKVGDPLSEEVGPVDWNWYKPQGGANPPYQPPFEVPPGWAPDDMGAHTSDFWDRFSWEPPPDPNSPDFPGPNRWDYQPPPE